MAKGLRSSVMKRNKAKLRAEVFVPIVDRRTERLSTKLQELVAKPKGVNMNDAGMEQARILILKAHPPIN